jgi:hypothetical protein
LNCTNLTGSWLGSSLDTITPCLPCCSISFFSYHFVAAAAAASSYVDRERYGRGEKLHPLFRLFLIPSFPFFTA